MPAQNKLYPKDLTVNEEWERFALRRDGRQFRITHADIRVAPEYLQRLSVLFGPAGVNLPNIKTIPQLVAAYSAWYGTASETERRRVPLRVGTRSVPRGLTPAEQMERRVLLSMTRYIHIQNVKIQLTPEGIASITAICDGMGINPTSITTLERFARLGVESAEHIIAKMLGVRLGHR